MADQSGTAFPSSPTLGQEFYRTDLGALYVYEGSVTGWVTMMPSTPAPLGGNSSPEISERFDFLYNSSTTNYDFGSGNLASWNGTNQWLAVSLPAVPAGYDTWAVDIDLTMISGSIIGGSAHIGFQARVGNGGTGSPGMSAIIPTGDANVVQQVTYLGDRLRCIPDANVSAFQVSVVLVGVNNGDAQFSGQITLSPVKKSS